jgi:hypothetical protein
VRWFIVPLCLRSILSPTSIVLWWFTLLALRCVSAVDGSDLGGIDGSDLGGVEWARVSDDEVVGEHFHVAEPVAVNVDGSDWGDEWMRDLDGEVVPDLHVAEPAAVDVVGPVRRSNRSPLSTVLYHHISLIFLGLGIITLASSSSVRMISQEAPRHGRTGKSICE